MHLDYILAVVAVTMMFVTFAVVLGRGSGSKVRAAIDGR